MIEFCTISKSFSGVRVLRDVSFAVPSGHTLGLVGENGAGKSTLMNILGGNLPPDTGQMLLNGQSYSPRNPQDAARHGIAFIHQELNLFANLSIAENIFLTAFPRSGRLPFIGRAAMRQKAVALLEQVSLKLAPDTLVERLSAGERQLVEIAKALSIDARLIILDEPTTSLSAREAEILFALMGRLRTRGLSMIFISHTLGDVRRMCDDIVVLRDGEVVGAAPCAEFTPERMITLMVGRSLNQLYPARVQRPAIAMNLKVGRVTPCAPFGGSGAADGAHGVTRPTSANWFSGSTRREGLFRRILNLAERNLPLTRPSGTLSPAEGESGNTPILEARHLTQPGIIRDVSFSLARGEVLGLSGLMGAGRSELARILFGLDPCEGGEVLLDGVSLHRAAPRRRIERGLAFLTENRRAEGLCLEAAIADNIALVSLRQQARPALGLLDFAALRRAVGAIREAVRLTPTARDGQAVKTLSGGNQQKVVLAKWLLAKPRALILDEPTRGIDVGARFEIYQLIHELADRGAGVLVISSEIEELIGICDRILVMSHGEIRDELGREEFDRERILRAALHDQMKP